MKKSTKFVILPPFRDPALNGIQKLVSFFEQIADMPQNRGCLSWDGAKGRGEGCKESKGERGGEKQEQGDGQEDLRLCKKK